MYTLIVEMSEKKKELIKRDISHTLGWYLCLCCWLWEFSRTGWTVVGFAEGYGGARLLLPPLRPPWTKRCGWSGLGGVLGAAGRSAGSGTTSSGCPLWSSRARLPPPLPLQAGSGAAAGWGLLGGPWESASCGLLRCRSRSPGPTQPRVRWPVLLPAGWRPAVVAGTEWLASHCSPEPQGPRPSQTAAREQPVNHSTL